MAVNEVPVAASFNTIVPAVAPAPVPKVKVWAPKFGLIFVPSMAAEAFTSAFKITPGAMAVALPEEVTSPVRLALVVTVAALPPILKLATGVVEVTINGAVPVATVEVNEPVRLRLVPVAAPITGVTRVGEVFITKVLPVPVCEATLVVLPTLVIGPVRLALVALFPFSFWIACRILSVAAIIPAPLA